MYTYILEIQWTTVKVFIFTGTFCILPFCFSFWIFQADIYQRKKVLELLQ